MQLQLCNDPGVVRNLAPVCVVEASDLNCG